MLLYGLNCVVMDVINLVYGGEKLKEWKQIDGRNWEKKFVVKGWKREGWIRSEMVCVVWFCFFYLLDC